MEEIAEVRFTTVDGESVAYEIVGHGDQDIVLALGTLPNLELSREYPFLRRWLERLAAFGRVIHFDRRGVGLSDPISPGAASLEARLDDIGAVMDAAGSRRAAIVTSVEGGPLALMFAATYPDRVSALVLYCSFARARPAPDYEVGIPEPSENAESMHHTGDVSWGSGDTYERLVGHPDDPVSARRRLGRLERSVCSPSHVRDHLSLAAAMDVRAVLPSVQAPVLALARSDAYPPPAPSRWLADHVVGGRYVEVPGRWLHSWDTAYEDRALDEVELFLTGVRPERDAAERFLATLMMTDVVESTRRAGAMGDGAWRRLLDQHDEATRAVLARHGGVEIKTTGDGFLARFDGPARAVRAAHEVVRAVADLGLEVRVGVHTGECERRGDDVAGMAVHLVARVASVAGPREVVVTSTVRDLVVGSELTFEDLGVCDLKGVSGSWSLVRSSPSPTTGGRLEETKLEE